MKRKRVKALVKRGAAIVAMLLLLTGCKKQDCAICGAEANRTIRIEGHDISICAECHETYIEIQQLFRED